jgi:hypothetical protein
MIDAQRRGRSGHEDVRGVSFGAGRVASWLAVVVTAVLLAGCASTNVNTRDEPLVTVEFKGKATEEVGMVVLDVFKRSGFELRKADKGQLEFLRRGGIGDDAIYGGWVSGDVWERVRIHIVAVAELEQRMNLSAQKVRSPGDHVFEESYRIRKAKRYEKELTEIQARLK